MKQIPKREGAVLNGYGLSVLSLVLILFMLPFASSLVISLGQTLGDIRVNSIHDYNQLNETEYSGIPLSGSWISSGDSLNSVCDEVINSSLPFNPFEDCETYGRGEAGYDFFQSSIGFYSDSLGANYVLGRGCADITNSSTSCGNNEFKMRVHDVNFDYKNDVLREFKFNMVSVNLPDTNKFCTDIQNSVVGANISLDYRVDYEIWEQRRVSPTSPEYWVKNKTIEGFSGNDFEFYNLIENLNPPNARCNTQLLIQHEFDFTDSQIWNNEVLGQLDEEIFNIYGQPKNQTVAFVISWDDVRDSDRNIPITRSSAVMPYEILNNQVQYTSLQLTGYETQYFNTATNTLTLILGTVFALTAFASTPYFNPTKSRIIDRLRDA